MVFDLKTLVQVSHVYSTFVPIFTHFIARFDNHVLLTFLNMLNCAAGVYFSLMTVSRGEKST
ncbi:hypothetical protein GGR51DRAFT_395118 [Nemania sp. FL0031]|nr:hypothetical protein GGR51DRAFT_395118 [Nemania sp. FL0031]